MSFWSYMGHRLLAGVLGVIGFFWAVASLATGHIFLALIGAILMVAAAYFFKTKH